MNPSTSEISRAAKIAISRLKARFSEREAEAIAKELISWATGTDYKDWLLTPKAAPNRTHWERIDNGIARLLIGEPLQYITQRAWFYGRPFDVGPGVLIPRPETEEMTSIAIEMLKSAHDQTKRILDIGSGSGCIPITIDLELPDSEVYGMEMSPEALAYSIRNQEKFHSKVNFGRVDVFECDKDLYEDLTMVISNPPYVPQSEKPDIEEHVKDHEPEMALFPPQGQETIFYEKITELASHWLRPGGILLFEIHEDFGQEILEIFDTYRFVAANISSDLSGKARFAFAQRFMLL